MSENKENIISILNDLLEADLALWLEKLPDHQEFLVSHIDKNKQLFTSKIKQLQTEYGNDEPYILVQKKIADLEKELADYFQDKQLHNFDQQKEILDWALEACPSDLKLGHFIKEDSARHILMQNPPQSLMKFWQLEAVEDLFVKMSALHIITISRYTELPKWQEIYKQLLAKCTANDFEIRELSYIIIDYLKYKDILRNSGQPNKPWRLSHNKVTGDIICFTVDNPEVFKTPFLQYLSVFIHYFFETAYAGKYYQLVSNKSGETLGQAVLDSFTNHSGKFDFFNPNVYSETVYWEEAIKLLAEKLNIHHLHFFADTVCCGNFYETEQGKKFISLNIVDHIWEANLSGGPFYYHFQEAFWKNIFQKIIKLSDEDFKKEILENLHMKDLDFTDYIINKNYKK
ncbi:MAG: hypothetical protein WCV71_03665 [Patescibacteria group bacterium]|jgi:hypothetical protein